MLYLLSNLLRWLWSPMHSKFGKNSGCRWRTLRSMDVNAGRSSLTRWRVSTFGVQLKSRFAQYSSFLVHARILLCVSSFLNLSFTVSSFKDVSTLSGFWMMNEGLKKSKSKISRSSDKFTMFGVNLRSWPTLRCLFSSVDRSKVCIQLQLFVIFTWIKFV